MPYPVICTSCHRTHEGTASLWKCPVCGGVLDLADNPRFDPQQVEQGVRSLWRYRHTFPLPADIQPISLGEGSTPLIPAEVEGHTVHFKLEFLSPTGSFKDRGTTALMTAVASEGIKEAVED